MKPWIRAAANLYPRRWRERYGAEFDALLDDSHAGWREFFNVLGGALKMQVQHSRSAWVLVVSCCVLGAIAAAAIAFAGREYVSTASLRVVASADQDIPAHVKIDQLQRDILSQSNLITIIVDPAFELYSAERARGEGMETIADRMRQDIHIESTATSLSISFAYRDKVEAQMVTDRLMHQFAERSRAVEQNYVRLWNRFRPNLTPPEPLQFVERQTASFPAQPVWPKLRSYVGLGLGGGLLLGFVSIYTWRRPRRALLLAASAVVGAVIGAGISFLVPDTFTSTARLLIRPPIIPLEPHDTRAAVSKFHAIEAQVFSESNLRWLASLRSSGVTGDTLLAMRNNGDIRVVLNNPPIGFTIQVSSRDRKLAKIVDDFIVMAFEEANARMERERAKASDESWRIHDAQLGENYEALDLGSLPDAASSPPRLFIAIAGLVLGLIAGAFVLHRSSGPVNPSQSSLGTV